MRCGLKIIEYFENLKVCVCWFYNKAFILVLLVCSMIEKKKRVLKIVVIVFFVLLVVIAADLMLPRGRIIEGEVRPVSKDSVEFLYDLTYESEDGSVVYEHQIFDRVFEMIDGAEEFVVVDMFLFEKSDGEVYRNLAQELTDHLL